MKILIAPDKFKGSLSAQQVCEAIAAGLKQKEAAFEITFHPMADGGDDSLTILANHIELKEEIVKTQDPLGRPLSTNYFTSQDAAFIEVASASGLVLLEASEQNPMYTSTFGTGLIIVDAISKGYQNIYLFLGGSATNDAGIGIAKALGFEFLNAENKSLSPTGKNLNAITSIQNNNTFDFNKINLTLFYDVSNALYGKNGAAFTYSPQKGANPMQVKTLDEGLRKFSKVLQKYAGIDVSKIAGTGSAGGIGAGLVALCNAKMKKGFETMAELTNLEKNIQEADWVISGEGKLDTQSLQGKVIAGIASLCQKHQKPLTLFVGEKAISEEALQVLGVDRVFEISAVAKNSGDAMANGAMYLEALAKGMEF